MKSNDSRWCRSNHWPYVLAVILLILSAIQDDAHATPIFGAIPSVAIAGDLATKMAALGAAKLGAIAGGGLAFKAVTSLLTGGLTQEQISQLRMLTPQQIEQLRQLQPQQVEMLRQLRPEQVMLLTQLEPQQIMAFMRLEPSVIMTLSQLDA